ESLSEPASAFRIRHHDRTIHVSVRATAVSREHGMDYRHSRDRGSRRRQQIPDDRAAPPRHDQRQIGTASPPIYPGSAWPIACRRVLSDSRPAVTGCLRGRARPRSRSRCHRLRSLLDQDTLCTIRSSKFAGSAFIPSSFCGTRVSHAHCCRDGEAMMNLPFLDTEGRVVVPPASRRLFREFRAVLTPRPRLFRHPLLRDAPHGDGHPVFVLPGFLTNDGRTRHLRRFLLSLGYETYGWGEGVNWGPTDHAIAAIERRLQEIRPRHGRKGTLIGHSLGGLPARARAQGIP